MRQRFPTIQVQGRRALVVAGDAQRLIMAGGGTSWLDLALYLIGRTVGIEAAMQVARINLIDWHHVGQQPFARLACTRQVEDAKQMLEASDQPVEAVAHEVGYEDAGFFSRLFLRKVNLTPGQYRKRFGALRRSLSL